MKKWTFVALLLILGLMMTTFSCGGGEKPAPVPAPAPTPAPAPALDKTPGRPFLKLVGPDPVTIDPHLVTDIGSHTYVGKLFSGLLRLDLLAVDKNNDGDFEDEGESMGSYAMQDLQEALNEKMPAGLAFFHKVKVRGQEMRGLFSLVPDMAKEVPEPVYNLDGTVSYIFELKDNAKFRNGREVTAWDFAYSFDRAADPQTRSSTAELYLGDILGVWEVLYGREHQGKKLVNRVYQFKADEDFDISKVIVDLPGVEVLDAKTLKITTKAILPIIFYYHLTYPTAAVVDKVQVDAAPRGWADNPNGTGPYWLEKKDVGQIVLRANKLYYGFQPRIDKIVYDISGGSTLSSYENNEIDLSGIGIADIQLARDPASEFAGEYFEATEMSTSYVGLNIKQPPFDDVKVRQAFAMSVNKEWLAKEVLLDLVQPAKGILPPGMPGYREDVKGLPFDPEKARQLLAESEYGGPEGLPRIRLTISGTGSAPSVVLQAMVRMWKDNLGVEVILDSIDYVTFLDKIKKGEFQCFSLGWIADYPDPENFLDLKLYGKRSPANNETGYKNEEFDALVEAARSEKDAQKRLQLYQQAEDIAIEEVPWILLFHGKDAGLIKPYLHDFFPTPMGVSIARYMYLE